MHPVLEVVLEILALYVFLCGTVGLITAARLCGGNYKLTKNGKPATEAQQRRFFYYVVLAWPYVYLTAEYK